MCNVFTWVIPSLLDKYMYYIYITFLLVNVNSSADMNLELLVAIMVITLQYVCTYLMKHTWI